MPNLTPTPTSLINAADNWSLTMSLPVQKALPTKVINIFPVYYFLRYPWVYKTCFQFNWNSPTPFSPPWSSTDPQMSLALSLLCTFVLTNLLSWHSILSSYYPHSICYWNFPQVRSLSLSHLPCLLVCTNQHLAYIQMLLNLRWELFRNNPHRKLKIV